MADAPLDALGVFSTLAAHEVDYVVIGGVAMQAHGHVRTTQDIDVIAKWTTENVRGLAAALRDLSAELRGVDADLLGIDPGNPRQLYDGGNFFLHTRHGDLDIFAADQVLGAPAYELLREHALAIEIRDVPLLVADVEHLIAMKQQSSHSPGRDPRKRAQDLDDIAVLESLRAQ